MACACAVTRHTQAHKRRARAAWESGHGYFSTSLEAVKKRRTCGVLPFLLQLARLALTRPIPPQAYLRVAPQVAAYPEYAQPLASHLLSVKVGECSCCCADELCSCGTCASCHAASATLSIPGHF